MPKPWIIAIVIPAGAMLGCGAAHTTTVYVPTASQAASNTPSAPKAPSAPKVTAQQLEAAAGINPSGNYHLASLHAVGEWAIATTSGVPQPERILFREAAGKWRVVHEPVVNALPTREVLGMSPAQASALGITIITPQAQAQSHERLERDEAERRDNESSERLARIERRQRQLHEETCGRLYREYQEGEPGGEAGEGAPRSRAAIQEYGRMGCR